jgi:EAL domain-containing protein (putative c-di-GMP-specific phosphodiesterase class I)
LPDVGALPVEDRGPAGTSWDDLLELAIRGEGVRAEFQPIVDVRRRVVAGYEALSRFDLAPGLGPDLWFAAAARRGVAAQLERAALRAALAHRGDLPPNCFLTLNVEPASLADPGVVELLAGQGHLGGLVIEVTEHREIEDLDRLDAVLDRLRAAGALVAVDDAGAGHSGLQQILRLRPSILKLDRSLVEGLDTDEAKVALAEMLGTFANRVDAWLLAEGVETAAEAQRVEQLGIPLGQGWFYARPAPPFCSLDRAVAELPRVEGRGRQGLHHLVHPLESVPAGAGRDVVATRHGAVVVEIDGDGRPLGLMTTDSALADTLVQPLRANVHTTPAELASRLATQTPPDTSSPVIVTDNAGRYLGIVTVQRLLHHLSGT